MKLLIIALLVAATQALLFFKKKEDNNEENTCGTSVASCQSSPYRSYDGSCNNLANPKWGTPNSTYARFTKDSYSDGVHEFPKDGSKPLTNPRDLSMGISPDHHIEDDCLTVANMALGQLVAHDMSLTKLPQTRISCCTNGQPLPSKMDASCAPVVFPDDDPYNHPEGNTCFNFVRTVTNKDEKCSVPGKAEQPISAVTAGLDLSIVYGSNKETAMSLRTLTNGLLKFEERNGEQYLPHNPNPSACAVRSEGEPCYLAGDVRANQHPVLTLGHTILMREHNRIALKLCTEINPHWDDERCFQEARKILIAKYQHITYYEYLILLLGKQNMINAGLIHPNATGFINDYDPKVNLQTLNEHAAAASRALHSTIVGEFELHSESRDLIGIFSLNDNLNRPFLIEDNPAGIARGFCTQKQKDDDRFYDLAITQEFGGNADLRATDLQRSRDFGVGSYFDVVEKCGLGKFNSFKDTKKYIKPEYVERLIEKYYNNPKAIELAVAIILETKENGTMFGPTFRCVVMEQFRRTRFGDQYFFENENSGFTIEQLNSIRTNSLSQLICDNVKGVETMQRMVLKCLSETNPIVPCSSLPREDLSLWKENTKSGNDTSSMKKSCF